MSELRPLPELYAVCRLPPHAGVPACFFSATRTAEELSVVCAERDAPTGVPCECGWRILEVAGPLEFALTGVLAAIATPLAEAGVSIFAVSTYNTDYVLVREHDLEKAVKALREAGHIVS